MAHQVAALIGDMVGSRRVPDRAGLQNEIGAILEVVGADLGGSPALTIGDEFQASFPTIEEAIEASLQLHLRAAGVIRLRIGIGWGELLAEDRARAPFGQDGPCWWLAREAIEDVERSGTGRGPERRTAFRSGGPIESLLNGYLVLRDTLLAGFDDVDSSIAIGLLEGHSQSELAAMSGLNKSSVSRRAHGHGILALLAAREIGALPV
jgi:SatD family (SatD)